MRFDSILVVCVGNICRSPTAERLLRQALPQKRITSAGISALVGQPADPSALEAAESHGLSLDGHEAQQLTRELCQQHDLILVMEQRHIDAVCQLAPAVRGKVMTYGHWLQRDIPDPYRKSREAFDFTYELLTLATEAWVLRLTK